MSGYKCLQVVSCGFEWFQVDASGHELLHLVGMLMVDTYILQLKI